MPYKLIEPDIAINHLNINIYRTYKNEDYNNPLLYWYTTSSLEEPEFEFDIREIKLQLNLNNIENLNNIDDENHNLILRYAIEQKILTLPDSVKYQH